MQEFLLWLIFMSLVVISSDLHRIATAIETMSK